MRKTAYLLAATLIAVTFCADRSMAATPVIQPEVTQFAEKLVHRLSKTFSRTAVAIVIFPQRQQSTSAFCSPPKRIDLAQVFVPPPISPFQFRLPPPAL
jgi:hypothetical protein